MTLQRKKNYIGKESIGITSFDGCKERKKQYIQQLVHGYSFQTTKIFSYKMPGALH